MLFNSVQFLIFFPLVVTGYFLMAGRYRGLWLLAASCYFYMAFIPIYILILLVTILIDYGAAQFIAVSSGARRRLGLTISIAATCLVLFFFKYYDFIIRNLNALAGAAGADISLATLGLILPIGLSFHTFQSLSYVVEVYRGKQRPERNFGLYALYVMFFPQLVAGPIERPQNLLHQFHEHHYFEYVQVRDGLRLMLWGLFKKVVVADRLSLYVSAVYANLPHHSGATVALATVFFAFQIYCDFSGYSDIAIGSARVLGFRLMTNFDKPYFSRSVGEFWRRWHISLSTWFRDYLYVPLGGNRVRVPRWAFNILFTFTVSGLWHGAEWTYVIWGALNGFYLLASTLSRDLRARLTEVVGLTRMPRIHGLLQVLITFVLTCIAWVFFRAPSFSSALLALQHVLFDHGPLFLGGAKDLIYGALGIVFVLWVDYWSGDKPFDQALASKGTMTRWSMYLLLLLWIASAGVFNASQFIYFQF